MTEWIIKGRFMFYGHATVEAETEEDAKEKFEAGEFDFDAPTAELADWERRGKPEKPSI